jgi:NhaP-type Na+/H+ or K+/H+ antiporter
VLWLPLGAFVVVFTLVSLPIKERLFVSDALVAVLTGVIFGPYCINAFDPFALGEPGTYLVLMLRFADILLAIQIVTAAISLDKDFWRAHWPSFSILLGPVTAAMWLVTTLLVWGIAGLPILDALLVGAACSPTDPVLANSIVKGRFADLHISPTVRALLSAESAANDGVGFPLVLFAIYLVRALYPQPTPEQLVPSLLTPPGAGSPGAYSSAGWAILAWFYEVILYQVCAAALIGIALGYVIRQALQFAESKDWIDKESSLAFSIALAAFFLGLGNVMNISAFVLGIAGGAAFAWDGSYHRRIAESHIQEVIDMLVSAAFFLFLGTAIPWNLLASPTVPAWRLVLLSITVLAFRRLPSVLALYPVLHSLVSWKEAMFAGYFGPVGVAAIWYAIFIRTVAPQTSPEVLTVTLVLVLSSIIGHGVSVPLTHLGITYSRTLSRDSAFRTPRPPLGWTGDMASIGNPILMRRKSEDRADSPVVDSNETIEYAENGEMEYADSERRRSYSGSMDEPPPGGIMVRPFSTPEPGPRSLTFGSNFGASEGLENGAEFSEQPRSLSFGAPGTGVEFGRYQSRAVSVSFEVPAEGSVRRTRSASRSRSRSMDAGSTRSEGSIKSEKGSFWKFWKKKGSKQDGGEDLEGTI